jgi:hypothetical protein
MTDDNMPNPIPARLIDTFRGYMDAVDDNDAPDGAWFQMLEDATCDFMRAHKLSGDANDAAHQYLRLCA